MKIRKSLTIWTSAVAIGIGTLFGAASVTSAATLTPKVPIKSAHKTYTTKIVSSDLTVYRGHSAYVTIQTTPGAECTIVVDYKSGPSHAKGLEEKKAPSSGDVTWSWLVGGNTSPGSWPVDIDAGGHEIDTYVHVEKK